MSESTKWESDFTLRCKSEYLSYSDSRHLLRFLLQGKTNKNVDISQTDAVAPHPTNGTYLASSKLLLITFRKITHI